MRRSFGYLPEERGLYPGVPVREQIVYFARLHGLPTSLASSRVDAMLERLGLQQYAARPAGELSKGNQQKVQIACAALHEPPLLVLDEPFSGLDIPNAEAVLALLREIQSRGTAVILSSHQMWQLETLCDTFSIVAGGETRLNGTLADMRNEWTTRVLRVEPPSVKLDLTLAAFGFEKLPAEGMLAYRVPAGIDRAAVLRRLVAVDDVIAFECLEPSLEEIYLGVTRTPAP